MGKLLFWVVVLAVGWFVWSLIRVSQRKQERSRAGLAAPVEIVACKHCGVFLPASDALPGPDGPYCSVEHRNAARRRESR